MFNLLKEKKIPLFILVKRKLVILDYLVVCLDGGGKKGEWKGVE